MIKCKQVHTEQAAKRHSILGMNEYFEHAMRISRRMFCRNAMEEQKCLPSRMGIQRSHAWRYLAVFLRLEHASRAGASNIPEHCHIAMLQQPSTKALESTMPEKDEYSFSLEAYCNQNSMYQIFEYKLTPWLVLLYSG